MAPQILWRARATRLNIFIWTRRTPTRSSPGPQSLDLFSRRRTAGRLRYARVRRRARASRGASTAGRRTSSRSSRSSFICRATCGPPRRAPRSGRSATYSTRERRHGGRRGRGRRGLRQSPGPRDATSSPRRPRGALHALATTGDAAALDAVVKLARPARRRARRSPLRPPRASSPPAPRLRRAARAGPPPVGRPCKWRRATAPPPPPSSARSRRRADRFIVRGGRPLATTAALGARLVALVALRFPAKPKRAAGDKRIPLREAHRAGPPPGGPPELRFP